MKKISQWLTATHPQFSKLLRHTEVIRSLSAALESLDLFSAHPHEYRILRFAQGIVYISVSTPAFATQLRHSSPRILRALQDDLPTLELRALHYKVAATPAFTEATICYAKQAPIPLSATTREKISRLAEQIDAENLKMAVQKLLQ